MHWVAQGCPGSGLVHHTAAVCMFANNIVSHSARGFGAAPQSVAPLLAALPPHVTCTPYVPVKRV